MNPLMTQALSAGCKIAGAEIGKRVGVYLIPSLAAPAARSFVGWSFGSNLGYLGGMAAQIAKEEAGLHAFSLAKGVAPVLGASAGGVAGALLFNGIALASGYVADYAYKLYEERNQINEENEFSFSFEEDEDYVVVNKAKI